MATKVIIDDNIIIKDQVCAAGSHMLYNFAPPFQAEAVDRLLAKGWEIAGQTHVGEFAMAGSETVNNAMCEEKLREKMNRPG